MHLNTFFWEGVRRFRRALKGVHGTKRLRTTVLCWHAASTSSPIINLHTLSLCPLNGNLQNSLKHMADPRVCINILAYLRKNYPVTLVICGVSPSLLRGCACVEARSDTQDPASTHLSHSLATTYIFYSMGYSTTQLFSIFRTNWYLRVLIMSGKCAVRADKSRRVRRKGKWSLCWRKWGCQSSWRG
jgi:hypothetical protein